MILEHMQGKAARLGSKAAKFISVRGQMSETRATVHSVQFLRAVAALVVTLFHGQQAFANRIGSAASPMESYLFGFGAVGVHVFFVISGFIMVFTSRFENGFDMMRFFRRRLLRIYPIYWLCAGCYLAVHALLASPYQLSATKVAGALLLLPGDAAAIIGPAWTLAFEMYFYLCFGLAMSAGLTRGLGILSCMFVAAVGLGALLPTGSALWELATNSLLLEFIAGATIGWLLVTGRLPQRGGGWAIVLSLTLYIAGIAWGYDRLPSVLVWGLPSALLVAGVVTWEAAGGAPRWMRHAGMLGDSSYALYLVHILIITLVVQAASAIPGLAELAPPSAAVMIAAIAFLAGELLHRKVERPALARLNPKRPLVPPRSVERLD